MISQRTLSFSKTEQKESCFTILLLLWFFLKDKWGERWTKNYDSLKETNLVGSLENRKDKIYCENVLFPGQIVKMWPQPTITFADIYKNMLWPTKEGNRDFSRSKKKKKKSPNISIWTRGTRIPCCRQDPTSSTYNLTISIWQRDPRPSGLIQNSFKSCLG